MAAAHKYKKLTFEQREEFTRMYQDKTNNLEAIAAHFGVHRATVNTWVIMMGLSKRNTNYGNGKGHPHNGKPVDVHSVAKMIFEEGKKLGYIAYKLRVKKSRLSALLKENGYGVTLLRDCKPSRCEWYWMCLKERWAIKPGNLPCYIERDTEDDPALIDADSTPSARWN